VSNAREDLPESSQRQDRSTLLRGKSGDMRRWTPVTNCRGAVRTRARADLHAAEFERD